ncbi:MAG: M23 family metallopeptidase [Nitrosomonas sp.]|jgi:hypothetical protein|nr:M23 family metallopeptidase [Nitrosomonas sp.]
MFPLRERTIIRGCQAHINAGLSCATDYEANYIADYVPFDGVLSNYWGTEGGNWCRLTRSNGDKIEMAHHSRYLLPNGAVKEGQAMAITGNSGSITTRPHLHIQIINKYGKRLDPEKYIWGKGFMNPNVKTYKRGAEQGILIPAATWEEYLAFCKMFGKDPNVIDVPL